MNILGIDPGTATIGWAVVQNLGGKLESLGYGHISTPKEHSPEERLQELRNDLQDILEKFHPHEAAVEELFFLNNQKTAMSVAEARGVILLTLADKKVRISGYTPLQVKQALTNYGRADKTQVQIMVKTLLRLPCIPKPDDVADALAIAICHASRRRVEQVTHSK